MTAPSSRQRERIAHRNALYRNLGGWKFEDVSKQAGVDLAALGERRVRRRLSTATAVSTLYVTNWGANALFRNRGDGTFEDVADAAGVAAGGWSTGCTFFDADGDGDLDLYVARYVETTWDSVRPRERSLVWRNGPHIMVGPAGLPGESDLFFENLGNGRFVEATERTASPIDSRVRLRRRRHRLRRRRVRRSVRGQRLESRTSSTTTSGTADSRASACSPASR